MEKYLKPLDKAFKRSRDAQMAARMSQYMKGQFDYFGIPAPQRTSIIREFLSSSGLPDEDILEEVVKQCWDQPQREYQYFAMALLAKMARKAEICRVDLYEYLILTKSWWDTVDYMASNLVGVHFLKFPEMIPDYTKKWLQSENIWLQRTCLIFQLKYGAKTDLKLLTTAIEQLEGSREFFINKAIGWALRQFSKTDAQWVINYVNTNSNRLAPLSQREALKWLERKGVETKI